MFRSTIWYIVDFKSRNRLNIQMIQVLFCVWCCNVWTYGPDWTETLNRMPGLEIDDTLFEFQTLLFCLSKNSPHASPSKKERKKENDSLLRPFKAWFLKAGCQKNVLLNEVCLIDKTHQHRQSSDPENVFARRKIRFNDDLQVVKDFPWPHTHFHSPNILYKLLWFMASPNWTFLPD